MPYSGEIAKNFATSTLKGGGGGSGTPLNPADTSLLVATGDGAKFPQPTNGSTYRLMVGTNDVMKVTGVSGDQLTLVRAASLPTSDPDYNAATPTTWPVGTTVQEVYSAASAQDPWTAINSGRVFNVMDNTYGAKGDGATDDRPAIQAALNAAHSAGGGCVYLPAATYLVSTTTNPTDNTQLGALFIYSNTVLIGDGPQATTIKLAATAANQAAVIMNAHVTGTGGNDSDITIRGLTVNGNSNGVNGLASVDRNNGIYVGQMRRLRVVNVDVKNVLGTTGGANGTHGTPGEGHHIIANYSSDVLYLGCQIWSDDGGPTGSGIAGSSVTDLRVVGCLAYGMQFGWGYTFYDCSALNAASCLAYSCNGGFFSEIGHDVVWTNCIAGTTASNRNAAYPFTTGQSLAITPNTAFASSGTIGFRMVNCTSYGGNFGCHLVNESSPAVNQQQTSIVGCRFANSTGVGLYLQGTTDVLVSGCHADNNGGSGFYVDTVSSGVVLFADCVSTGNTNYGYECHGASISKFVWLRDCQASGNTVADVLDNNTSQPIMGLLTAPGVPATTVALNNPYCRTVDVYVNANGATFTGTGTQINGSTTGATTGLFRLRPNETITLNYSAGTPSWTWFAN